MRRVPKVRHDVWVKLLERLSSDPLEGCAFAESEIAALLGHNASRILGLDDAASPVDGV
jgi:hypothetical protein